MADLIVVLKATSSFAQKAAGISPSLNSNNYGKGGGGGRYNSNVLPLSPNALEVTPASLLEAKGNPSSDNENRHGAYGRGNGRSNLNSNFISNTSAVNSGFHLSTSSGVLTDQVVSTEAHLVVSLCVCVL
jgi:hypothetical protein